MNILFVANKKLPSSDYRVRYGLLTGACMVHFGLPGRPDDVPEDRYMRVDVGEGLGMADMVSLARLWSALRNRAIDCIHFSATVLILLGPYVAAAAGKPCMITLTGFGRTFTSERLVYRILRPLYWLLMAGAVRIAVRVLVQNTGDLEAMCIRYPRHASKIVMVGSGFGGDVRTVERPDKEVIRVLLVARLLPDKGIDDFLKVASRLRGSGFRFVLVGPAVRGSNTTLQAVRRVAAAGDIEYLGELHGTRLNQEYDRSHVLLFPSVGEGMSRVMLEAGFAGLCPVAYDIASNRDLIRPGGGVLVRSGDHDGLVVALEQLAADKRLIRSNATAYQQHVVMQYGMDAFVRRMDAVVNSLKLADVDDRSVSLGTSCCHAGPTVRIATRHDLEAVVDIHREAFPGFFLTNMGPRFLAAYYKMVLGSPEGIMLVALKDEKIAGFVSGFVEPSRFYRRMRRNLFLLGIPAAIRLFGYPRLLLDVSGRVLRVGVSGHPQGRQMTDVPAAELSSLAVRPSLRRHGHARRLVTAFLTEAFRRGMENVHVTTDASDNQCAHAFYSSLGFERTPRELGTGRRRLTEYTIPCIAVERAA